VKDFQSSLQKTVQWYIENKSWLNSIISDEYKIGLQRIMPVAEYIKGKLSI